MKTIKVIALIGLCLLCMTGCKECVKSHEEEGTCVSYTYIYTGKTYMRIPHYYSCVKTICDEYEEVENENI